MGWPAIARGDSTLVLAPTGSGKTLAAFLWAINRLMFSPVPPPAERCRDSVHFADQGAGGRCRAQSARPAGGNRAGSRARALRVSPAGDRRPHRRHALSRARPLCAASGDILITTPESLYLLLTSNARKVLTSIETVILDEIHALVPTKRGSHLALSLERLEALCGRKLQRIGLSATQRPLEEVAHFLGGAETAEPKRG